MPIRPLQACLVSLCLLAGAASAAESQPYLEQRVQTLEQQVRELGDRLRQLEQRPAAAAPQERPAYAVPLEEANAPPAPVVPGWKTGAGWKKLRQGMNQIQVTQLLGNPAKRSGDRYTERWQYPDDSAWVEFDQVGEVTRWQSPSGD
jgi:outer membrane murein-binding lipoprotein Lpp